MYKINLNIYMSGLFVFMYLLISAIAEPAFNNSVAIPLALTLAIAFSKYDQITCKESYKRIGERKGEDTSAKEDFECCVEY